MRSAFIWNISSSVELKLIMHWESLVGLTVVFWLHMQLLIHCRCSNKWSLFVIVDQCSCTINSCQLFIAGGCQCLASIWVSCRFLHLLDYNISVAAVSYLYFYRYRSHNFGIVTTVSKGWFSTALQIRMARGKCERVLRLIDGSVMWPNGPNAYFLLPNANANLNIWFL